MKILVVSGFLGAGKTSFIKELIRRTGELPVILENEYGENDLDSQELAKTGELEILEFMEGCVCCTKKDSFANTILSISAAMDPELLVVEPTGVGKLSSILSNIERVSWERIELLDPVVVVSPRSLWAHLQTYPEICRDQLAHARIIVLSKIENETDETIAAAVKRIREINPNAEIVRRHYTEQSDSWWHGLFELRRTTTAADHDLHGSVPDMSRERGGQSLGSHSGRGRQSLGSSRERGEQSLLTQRDLEQVSFKNCSLPHVGALVQLLEGILHGQFGSITRAKGVLRAGHELLRFDLADGLYGIIHESASEASLQCVFIGENIARKKLAETLGQNLRKHARRKLSHEVSQPQQRAALLA
ncbi:MAG: GTP-binding protein [Atopobiaceae bacterium]|nr:GTP-binding protein [Atopobiaceae bacterium]